MLQIKVIRFLMQRPINLALSTPRRGPLGERVHSKQGQHRYCSPPPIEHPANWSFWEGLTRAKMFAPRPPIASRQPRAGQPTQIRPRGGFASALVSTLSHECLWSCRKQVRMHTSFEWAARSFSPVPPRTRSSVSNSLRSPLGPAAAAVSTPDVSPCKGGSSRTPAVPPSISQQSASTPACIIWWVLSFTPSRLARSFGGLRANRLLNSWSSFPGEIGLVWTGSSSLVPSPCVSLLAGFWPAHVQMIPEVWLMCAIQYCGKVSMKSATEIFQGALWKKWVFANS